MTAALSFSHGANDAQKAMGAIAALLLASGREQTLTHVIGPAPRRRQAVVVGAGPAGLEAARVLGERGHHVVVVEAADLPGGQVRLAAAASRRRDLIGIVDWRVYWAPWSAGRAVTSWAVRGSTSESPQPTRDSRSAIVPSVRRMTMRR